MNNRTKTVICVAVAMAASGFAHAESSKLPTLEKAAVVGAVAAVVMSVMLFLTKRSPNAT